MNAKTLEAITRHGNTLLAIFPDASEKDPVALCKKLRRIETRVSRSAVDYCNGVVDSDAWETASRNARSQVERLFGNMPVISYNFSANECADCGCKTGYVHDTSCTGGSHSLRSVLHINGDPRGYALKLDDAWTRQYNRTTTGDRLHSDMGGYGILAPDLTA